jgi:hypothetical protein
MPQVVTPVPRHEELRRVHQGRSLLAEVAEMRVRLHIVEERLSLTEDKSKRGRKKAS